MDFIERIFHIAPDGGSGLLELIIMLTVVAVPLVVAALRNQRAWRLSLSRSLQNARRRLASLLYPARRQQTVAASGKSRD